MLNKGLTLLDSGEVDSICEGARLLGELGDARAIEPLLRFLTVRNEVVKDSVRDALGRLDVAPLLVGWWRSEDAARRAYALDCAVPLSHEGLMAIYREAASVSEPRLRKRVATGLRHQQVNEETMGMLAQLSGDEDHDVRWWAIDTLSLISTEEARAILQNRLVRETDTSLVPFIERALTG